MLTFLPDPPCLDRLRGEAAEPETPAAVLEAGGLCQTSAANLADLFDRHDADWSDVTADELAAFVSRINALHTEALALLGHPRVRGYGGALVPDWGAAMMHDDEARVWRGLLLVTAGFALGVVFAVHIARVWL